MWWRLSNNEYQNTGGGEHYKQLKTLAQQQKPLGILSFTNGQVSGWCSVSPRKSLKRLENSRLFKPTDNSNTWSITCLYIARNYRKQRLSVRLVQQATQFAFSQGADYVEAYPISSSEKSKPDVFVYVGLESSFAQNGFQTIRKASATRLLMRIARRGTE